MLNDKTALDMKFNDGTVETADEDSQIQTTLERAKKAVENLKAIETVETKSLKSQDNIVTTSQICVTETKNLEAEPQTTEVLRRNETGEFKQKIFEYALWLKSNGKSEATIIGRVKLLRRLTKRGANLYDPESVKTNNR